jgi:hypothetical protein
MGKTELLEALKEVTDANEAKVDANLKEIEQTRQQIRESMAITRAVISRGELEDEDDCYEKMKQLLAHLHDRLQEGMKAQQAMFDDRQANSKIRVLERRKAENKAKWEVDRKRQKANFKKRVAEWEGNFKMITKMNADQEESKACLEKTEDRLETGLEQSNTETDTDRE